MNTASNSTDTTFSPAVPAAGGMTRRQGTYLNIAVSVLTGVLAMNVLGSREPVGISTAQANAPASAPPADAGDDSVNGRISAAEQRKQIIAELKTLNQKFDRVDSMLKSGISVKVTDMPASKEAKSESKPRPEGKPEPRIEVRQAPAAAPSSGEK